LQHRIVFQPIQSPVVWLNDPKVAILRHVIEKVTAEKWNTMTCPIGPVNS
jgi:hypothetical protein